MSLLKKIKAIGKLRKMKFAPTKDPYELTRRMIPIVGADEMKRQMYRGINKDARKAYRKGELDKMIADIHSSDSLKALLADADMTMEEVDAIIKNATKN